MKEYTGRDGWPTTKPLTMLAGTDFVLVLDAPEACACASNLDRSQVVRVTREFLLTLGGVDCVPPTVG